MRPVGIGETLCRALAKLIIKASGEHAKKACGNIHLCAGIKAGIEGETHAVLQQQLERARARWSKEVAGS